MNRKEEIAVIPPKDILIGNSNAPFTLVQYVDYESEKCVQAHAALKEVMDQFKTKINFNFRHFPKVSVHQRAHKAAEAAIAAAQEGKVWEMHEMLLANRRHLGTITLKSYAKEVGCESKTILNDLINGKYGWYVQDDLRSGLDLGIKEAPAFVLNGEKLEGNITAKTLTNFINASLKKKKVKKAA